MTKFLVAVILDLVGMTPFWIAGGLLGASLWHSYWFAVCAMFGVKQLIASSRVGGR